MRSAPPPPLAACIVAVACSITPALHAQYDSLIAKPLTWRNIGPNRGGRSLAVAGSPGRPLEYYFGAVGGGLWKTTDGGTTWRPVTDGQIKSSSVGAVAVSESSPDVVYIGMGETELRGNIMQGDGVYKSTDAGKTWRNVGLAETQAIAKIRVHPTNPDIVYVAALGHPYGRTPERGVFRSRDGGRTWQKILFRGDSAGAIDLALDPTNPSVLYATTWQVYRTPYKLWGGGPGSGLFKSTDGGDTWTELTKHPGMPAAPVGKIGVAVSPARPARVWALVEAAEGGVFRSDDGGGTWTRTNDDRKIRQRAFYYTRIYADPKNPDVVYALNTGFYKSIDGGVKFDTVLRPPHGDQHDLWIAPNDPDRMINANDGGANVSTNGGRTWTEQDFPTAQLYHVTTTSDSPYHVCGAQQDNSTVCVPSDDWANMQAGGPGHGWYYAVGGGESGYITQSPTNPDVFYAGSQGALITRYDRSSGQIRDIQVYPRFFSGEPSSALPERWQWTFPIVFSPVDPAVLYACSQHVWKTTNDGQSWERISPDLTLADPASLGPSGGLITNDMNGPEVYGTVFALAPSYQDVNTIWAGSDDGLIHVTRDGGKSWQNVTPPDMSRHTRVSILDASRHDAATAFVAAKRYQMDDRAPYIWRTHDYGKTWTKIVSGIAAGDYVHAVREDPVRRGLLYAGTEHGVWVSFDDGDRWRPLQLDLPDVQVSDMVVLAHDLVIGTHGRSMYVLDDIDPLRELTPELARAPLHLFQPHDAVRRAENATIYYALARPADTVTVDILDSTGTLIRRFTSSAGEQAPLSDEEAFFGAAGPRPPTTNAGLNRFQWDLRYPGATTFAGMIVWSARPQAGPLAPPGTYQARVTAGGASETKTFHVRLDPRLKGVTAAHVQEQFALAMRIRDKTSAANEGVIRIRQVKAAVADRQKQAHNRDVDRAAAALVAKLSAIEEELYQVRNRSNQDPLNFPIKLNNRLAALGRSVETGDARPTDAASKVLDELSGELAAQLARLDGVLATDLKRFNDVLTRRRLEPVKTS